METEELVASPPEQGECEAGELFDDEEEGQIVDDDIAVEQVDCETDNKENGGCDPTWMMGDEEGEIIDDEPMEGSSLDERHAPNHRKRPYSDEQRNGSNSASPAPEDKKSAFEKFRNLSFAKKNPFADGSTRDTRSGFKAGRYRSDRDGASRNRRDEAREEEARRRERRFDRERMDRRDRELDDRRSRMSPGRESVERESRRDYGMIDHSPFTPPTQPNYGGYGLPGSLHERMETFVQAPENQLCNVSDDEIFNKLVELLELHNEQKVFIRRRDKQLDDLRASIETEHDEIDRIKQDLPTEYFSNQTNGGSECQNNFAVEPVHNANSTVPPDAQFANRNFSQPPPMEVIPPVGQFSAPPPSIPHNVNGIHGYAPNVPPPSSMPPPAPLPMPAYTNPPPFDAARPPPPIVSETIGGISIPPHLLPHSLKPSTNTTATNPPIPVMPDFSVPPPGFAPTSAPVHVNSPGPQERFSTAPGYGNDRYPRNSEVYNREPFRGDRYPSPSSAPTPLRNVVATAPNANTQSNWAQSNLSETDSTRLPTESPISNANDSNPCDENQNTDLMEETHEPVSAPASAPGSPHSAMSAISDEYENDAPSTPPPPQSETYDEVSDDEEGGEAME